MKRVPETAPVALAVLIFIATGLFYGAVAFVVLHFLVKYW